MIHLQTQQDLRKHVFIKFGERTPQQTWNFLRQHQGLNKSCTSSQFPVVVPCLTACSKPWNTFLSGPVEKQYQTPVYESFELAMKMFPETWNFIAITFRKLGSKWPKIHPHLDFFNTSHTRILKKFGEQEKIILRTSQWVQPHLIVDFVGQK